MATAQRKPDLSPRQLRADRKNLEAIAIDILNTRGDTAIERKSLRDKMHGAEDKLWDMLQERDETQYAGMTEGEIAFKESKDDRRTKKAAAAFKEAETDLAQFLKSSKAKLDGLEESLFETLLGEQLQMPGTEREPGEVDEKAKQPRKKKTKAKAKAKKKKRKKTPPRKTGKKRKKKPTLRRVK